MHRRLSQIGLVVLLFDVRRPGMRGSPQVARQPPASGREHHRLARADVFVISIVGEDKLPKDFRVAPDGTVDLPLHSPGEGCGARAEKSPSSCRKKLVEGDILRDPSVAVDVKEYNSKRVVVLGQVQKPGSFPLTPGFTLIQAISTGRRLQLHRQPRPGEPDAQEGDQARTIVLSVDAITDGSLPDIPLRSATPSSCIERVLLIPHARVPARLRRSAYAP